MIILVVHVLGCGNFININNAYLAFSDGMRSPWFVYKALNNKGLTLKTFILSTCYFRVDP